MLRKFITLFISSLFMIPAALGAGGVGVGGGGDRGNAVDLTAAFSVFESVCNPVYIDDRNPVPGQCFVWAEHLKMQMCNNYVPLTRANASACRETGGTVQRKQSGNRAPSDQFFCACAK